MPDRRVRAPRSATSEGAVLDKQQRTTDRDRKELLRALFEVSLRVERETRICDAPFALMGPWKVKITQIESQMRMPLIDPCGGASYHGFRRWEGINNDTKINAWRLRGAGHDGFRRKR